MHADLFGDRKQQRTEQHDPWNAFKHASQNNECNEGHGQERRSSSAARSRANCVGQTRPNSIAETRRAEYEMLPSLFGGILAVPGKRNLAARDKAPKWRGQPFGQCPFWN